MVDALARAARPLTDPAQRTQSLCRCGGGLWRHSRGAGLRDCASRSAPASLGARCRHASSMVRALADTGRLVIERTAFRQTGDGARATTTTTTTTQVTIQRAHVASGAILPRPSRTSEDTRGRWTSEKSQQTEDRISEISAQSAPTPACRHANLASDSYQVMSHRWCAACLALQLLGMRDTSVRSKDPAILNSKGMHFERMAVRNFARPAAQVMNGAAVAVTVRALITSGCSDPAGIGGIPLTSSARSACAAQTGCQPRIPSGQGS